MDQNSEVFEFLVTDEYDGMRIDKLISELIDSLSRTYIKKLIDDKKVSCNGKVVKASFHVSENDEIVMEIPPVEIPQILPQDIPLDIIYEDDDVVVVNKPKDMVVHPAAGHYKDTLVNAIMYHCKDNLSGINGVMRPGIVHRIDKDTTGSVIICKNDNAHQSIAEQLKEHSINRVYHAICYGIIKEDEGDVTAPIGRSTTDRKKMAVVPGGKYASTHYRVLKRFEEDGFTYIECKLQTGRTHQIRVHMSHIGHPLLGDEVYAPGRHSKFKTNGQCLHAKTLGFIHPVNGQYIETDAPLPEYFNHLLNVLK
ncbi:MAG: RluA family pseudouridine synthase [Butyrivibrio sp.]|uniref:RluA family pseudouridine synthase n=1 Tax=Butyrivibrio sp. TaxID=28121 RepID=UPI0025BB6006|nr:RluA family pseudouridine synthase [Butyrivibrio sp.]MBQ6587853.1 RluA family pseudouridine synthase [Butyrivibrio sp.]